MENGFVMRMIIVWLLPWSELPFPFLDRGKTFPKLTIQYILHCSVHIG